MGEWSSAKMLLDVYGHYMPREMRGFLRLLGTIRPHQTAPRSSATVSGVVLVVGTY